MAVQKIIAEKCVGCKACVKSCPADVFRYDTVRKKAIVAYPQDCQLCLWCVTECPMDAVVLTNEPVKPPFTCWG